MCRFVETKQKPNAMTKTNKKERKQILSNQIVRLAKIIISIDVKDDRFMRAVQLQCKAIREKHSI